MTAWETRVMVTRGLQCASSLCRRERSDAPLPGPGLNARPVLQCFMSSLQYNPENNTGNAVRFQNPGTFICLSKADILIGNTCIV